MKKKFLLYVAVAVTLLFLGFTVFYISKNDESMYLNLDNSKAVYINVNDVIEWPVVWSKPYKDTKLSVVVGNEAVLKYDEQTQNFTGKSGGFTNVTITSSNTNFGPFVFEVYVGDGNVNSPFVIKNATELAKIGVDDAFGANKCYTLASDIDVKAIEGGKWTALPEFSGSFNGNGHTIYNLNIEDATHAGLFSKIASTGRVENINFAKVAIEGSYDYLGVVAGINKGFVGKINVSGSIKNNQPSSVTGGIVGQNEFESSAAYVNMCSTDLTATVAGSFGGLVGLNYSSVVLNSSAIINYTTNNGLNVGGLVGVNQSAMFGEVCYPAAIIKSYVVVNALAINENDGGAVVGKNLEDEDNLNTLNKNKYENIIYALGDGVELYVVGASEENEEIDANATITQMQKSDLLLIDTYKNNNFNLDTVWSLAENEYAKLNFLGNYETIIIKGMGQETYSSELDNPNEDFKAFLLTTTSDLVFYVDSDIVLDLQGAEWETIAKDPKNPFQASIIVEDGGSCTIKNFKLSGNNSSFFGYIGANTQISGIKFENVTVSSTADSVAVVATSIEGGATLDNLTVSNVTLSSVASNVALIVATNNGNITNSVISGANNLTVSATKNITKNIGSVVATNNGVVSGTSVSGVVVAINTASESGNFNIGGAVALSSATVTNCAVNSFTLSTTNEDMMYVGGVVGYTTSTASVTKSYSKANLTLNTNNEDGYLGGVVAYVANGATISGSAFAQGTIKGYYVGGVACLNNGSILTSYAEGTLEGMVVAGIATKCFGTINNVYTLSKLVGVNQSSVLNGITGLVGPDCTIDKCFSSANFSGEGAKYAESSSEFRTTDVVKGAINLVKFLFTNGGNFEFGEVSNLVIINYGDAQIQSSIFGGRSGWIDVTEEDCKGKDDYAVLKEQAGFNPSVWDFTKVGSFPTLKDAVVIK